MKESLKTKVSPSKIFNKSFYRFSFGFVTVIASVLVLILVMGSLAEV